MASAYMQATSRASLGEAVDRLNAVVDRSSAAELGTLGDELFALLRVVRGDRQLRAHLADQSIPGAVRAAVVDRLFADRVGRLALDVLSELVSARWSRPGDLVETLETLARQATLGVAEKDGTLDDVEDQLFGFGRVLNREPQLTALLSDWGTPADNRVALLRSLLEGKASPVTVALMSEAVRAPAAGIDITAEELSELAAARRDRYIAHVRTPVRLGADQEQRLTETLTRLYGRPISVQAELDPDLLGGLVVRVGGEIIDGSVAGRLATARRRLPH
jgi:F-type H+-transporting ATPase subunit delta